MILTSLRIGKVWKRVFLLSVLFLCILNDAQEIIRFSDKKRLDSIMILDKNSKQYIHKKEIASKIKNNTVLIYNNKKVDYSINNDTLIIFDMYKEIEEINLTAKKYKNYEEIKVKKKARYTCKIFNPVLNGLFIDTSGIDENNKYLKSIFIFPKRIFQDNGKLLIAITESENGFPVGQPLLEFSIDIAELNTGSSEIILPRLLKLTPNGFFVMLSAKPTTGATNEVMSMKCSEGTNLFLKENVTNWRKLEYPGFLYKLKIVY